MKSAPISGTKESGRPVEQFMESVQKQSLNRRSVQFWAITLTLASAIVLGVAQPTEAQQRPAPVSARKPNILVIMGDDIGWLNVSAYNLGLMGYRTPNIDRIAKERCSPTGTLNRVAPRGEPLSLPDN